MDQAFGSGWRLVLGEGATEPAKVPAAIRVVDLATTREADGVVSAWIQRHQCQAALVRPDNYVFGTGDALALVAEWEQRLTSPQLAPAAV